jgi:hypothetical protein
MPSELTVLLYKGLAVLMLVAIPFGQMLASTGDGHLLPSQANFDTLAPYGKRYAEILEKLLFPASSWTVRYFEARGYSTGLTIYQKPNGSHWLMLRQATPDIGSIVVNAFYKRVDLQSSLASVKIEPSNREVPAEVALEMRRLWLALLRETRPRDKVDDTVYIHPPTVILSAKDGNGITLTGKYPPDAAKHRKFTALEAIVDDLVKSCDAPDKDRIQLLRRAAKRARNLRENLDSR